MRYIRPVLALTAMLSIALLGGCGGGGGGSSVPTGGNGGSYPYPSGGTSIVIGKVVDVGGSPVVGATVAADTGQSAATLSQGGYRLDGVPAGIRRIRAAATQNGVSYTGSTQVLSVSANPSPTVSNATIQVSPSNQQASVTGTVRDNTGQPIAGARVLLAVFATPGTDSTGNPNGALASLVAFADANGVYRIENVPAPVSQYTIDASVQGAQNTRIPLANLQVGETRHQDFTLGGAFNQGGPTPTNVVAYAFTQPGSAQTPFALAAGGSVSPYEQMRRALAPAYAQRVARSHAAAGRRQAAHSSPFGAYAVEADVFFDNAQPDSAAGFRIYSSDDTNPLAPYDFLQDPLASVYTDLDPAYTPGRQYNFAVSAVNTNNSETGLSNTSSVTPLDLLAVTQPQNGHTLSSPATIVWNLVNGASSYAVFIYPQFPGAGITPMQYTVPGGQNTFTLPGMASGDYYVAVGGRTSNGSAVTISAITRFHVP